MSKKNQSVDAPKEEVKIIKSYSLVQKDGGYAVVQLSIQGETVVEAKQIHDVDVLSISLAILQKAIQKDFQ